MEFVRTLNHVSSGRKKEEGSLLISDGELRIKINEADSTFDKVGVLKDGIGVVIKKSKKKLKTPYLKTTFKYNEDDIPINLQGESYKFKIPAEKLSDTEFVFKFDKAIMLNKK